MNEEERWIQGQGPPPPEIRELFDARRAPLPMSADVPEELERRVLAAFEADRRREARARNLKWAMAAAAVLAIGVAGGVGALALRRTESADREAMPRSALARSRAMREAPPKPAEARPVDAGSAGRP